MIPTFFERRLEIAAEIWSEISIAQKPADRWLNNYFYQKRRQFGSQDRRFYSELIFCLFRHKIFLRAWAEKLFPSKEEWGMLLLAVCLESLAPWDDIFDASVQLGKSLKKEVVEAVQKFRLPPSSQAVSSTDEWSLQYSCPPWLTKRWTERYGRELCQSLLKECQSRPPLAIRVNTLKITRDDLLEKFKSQKLKARRAALSPFGIIFEERANILDSEEFREGLFEVQDEGSQLLGVKIDPQPGELIWDVCAGGGGKTLLLGAMMQNKGRVVATDIRPKKLEELSRRAKRAGLFNIFPADLNRMNELKAAQKGFDRILVDAPCSGTGTLRRNPDAKWKLSEEKIMFCQKDQLAILENTVQYLKPGGRIYYATCSLEPEENEQVMEKFLSVHPELKLIPDENGKPFFKLFPPENQTDGFFLGIAEKQER